MPNKTIYVSDDDLSLLDRAQELSGSNLSSTIAVALRQFVAEQESRSQGHREIVVRVGGAEGTRRQRFRGHRLARWQHVSAQSRRTELFSVYRTEKGQFAVHIQRGPEWLLWTDPEDETGAGWVHAWRARMASRMGWPGHHGPGGPGRAPFGAGRPPVPPVPPQPPRPPMPPGWGGVEGWPTSGGNAGDWAGAVESTLRVFPTLESMREELPGELCDLVERALSTPEVEDLDI